MFRSLWHRVRDYILLVVLLVVSLVVLLSQNGPLFRSARALSLQATAPVEGTFTWTDRYTRALDENDELRADNIALAAEVARLREARRENDRLRALVAFRDSVSFDMVPARIVGKDITKQDNLLTLNVGTSDSVRVGMAVIDERGIIGKVVLASENYALVMPHQNTDFRVPAQIELLGRDGVVRWDGTAYDRLLMEYVGKTEPVVRGQLVVTSGFSGTFPPGIPVGKVDSVFAAKGRNDLVIYLEPSAALSTVDYVYVLLDQISPEREELENTSLR
ncbi:MAG: rod shape-determining protein MreC [Rhodothermales bacterium]